jgi:hypothetical protein
MNKYFSSLIFVSYALFFSQIAANDPFEKLAPGTIKGATAWLDLVATTLSEELQLAYLNLFALNSEESIPAFIKCIEYIESQNEMLPTYELLGTNIMKKIKKYAERIQSKISRKKDLTETEEESLWQKLEAKIQELIAYINGIYYQVLYNHVAQKSSSSPVYMFDENGIIPQEKRTKCLPKPE